MKKFLIILSILFLLCAFHNVSAQEKPAEILKRKPIVDLGSGILIGKAIKLVKPPFPSCNCKFSNNYKVVIQFTVNENGNVEYAKAIAGHPALRNAAEQAIRNSKFSVSRIDGAAVKAYGTITYIFLSSKWKSRVVKYELKLEK